MLDWKNVAAELKTRLASYERRTDIRGAGVVLSAGDGVVQLDGLGGCKLNELLEFALCPRGQGAAGPRGQPPGPAA